MSILVGLSRMVRSAATALSQPRWLMAVAQIVAGLAVLLESESVATVASHLLALGEGVAETGSVIGGLGLVVSGLATPVLKRAAAVTPAAVEAPTTGGGV